MAEADFKRRTQYGVSADWPITYQDLSPYYDKSRDLYWWIWKPRKYPERAGWHFSAGA